MLWLINPMSLPAWHCIITENYFFAGMLKNQAWMNHCVTHLIHRSFRLCTLKRLIHDLLQWKLITMLWLINTMALPAWHYIITDKFHIACMFRRIKLAFLCDTFDTSELQVVHIGKACPRFTALKIDYIALIDKPNVFTSMSLYHHRELSLCCILDNQVCIIVWHIWCILVGRLCTLERLH